MLLIRKSSKRKLLLPFILLTVLMLLGNSPRLGATQEPGTERSTVPEENETVEVRLLVLDEDKNPIVDTEVDFSPNHEQRRIMMVGISRRLSWKTDKEGRITEKISREFVHPDARPFFMNFERRLVSGSLRWNIPEGWTPDKPIELTVTLFKERKITGTVVDREGKPVANALVCYRIGKEVSLYRENEYRITHEDGKFELKLTPLMPLKIHVFHPTLGAAIVEPDYSAEMPWKIGDDVPDDWLTTKRNNGPFTLELVHGDPVTVKVVDPEGNPIEGVAVYPTLFETEKDSWSSIGLAIYRKEFSKVTDKSGIVEYHWLPTPAYQSITFNARGSDRRFNIDKNSPAYLMGWGSAVWQAEKKNNDLVIPLPRKLRVEGSVRYADGSIPQPMQLFVSGSLHGEYGPGGEFETDAQGNFTYLAHPHEKVFMYLGHRSLLREENPIAAVPGAHRDVDVGDGTKPAPRFDFVLQPAVKVFIRIPWGFSKHMWSIHKVSGPEDEVNDNNGWFGPSKSEKELYNEGYEYWLLPGFYRFKFDNNVSDVLLEVREGNKEWHVDFFKEPATVSP